MVRIPHHIPRLCRTTARHGAGSGSRHCHFAECGTGRGKNVYVLFGCYASGTTGWGFRALCAYCAADDGVGVERDADDDGAGGVECEFLCADADTDDGGGGEFCGV